MILTYTSTLGSVVTHEVAYIGFDRYWSLSKSRLVFQVRQNAVHLLGGYLDWNRKKRYWHTGVYHEYDPPKMIGSEPRVGP